MYRSRSRELFLTTLFYSPPVTALRRAAPRCRALPNLCLAPPHATGTRLVVSPARRAGKQDHHASHVRSLSLITSTFDLLQLVGLYDRRRRKEWTTDAVLRCAGRRSQSQKPDRSDSDTP